MRSLQQERLKQRRCVLAVRLTQSTASSVASCMTRGEKFVIKVRLRKLYYSNGDIKNDTAQFSVNPRRIATKVTIFCR